ncbi:hypothetical protein [Persephonella sp.]
MVNHLKGFLYLAVVCSVFLFSSCKIDLGDSDGTSSGTLPSQPGDNPTIPDNPIAVQQVSVLISGTITDRNGQPLDVNALVNISSVDRDGNQIDRKSVNASSGQFASQITLTSGGGSVVISASADGYNTGITTVEYASPAELDGTKLSVVLDSVITAVIPVDSITIMSDGKKLVRFGIYRDADGRTSVVTGKEIVSMGVGEKQPVVDLSIPLNALSADVSSIQISYRDYQPSNPDDFQSFPGSLEEGGRELISFGFDYMEITDPQTGQNPFATGDITAQLVAGEYVRIFRRVDCNQIQKIKSLLGTLDMLPDKNGVQFEFWAFDFESGRWLRAGYGTFVSSSVIDYNTTIWDYIILNGCSLDPNSVYSCESNKVIVDENQICENGTGYVVISVTNPLLDWKNLDYIRPAAETVGCDIYLRDDAGNPVSTRVTFNPDSNCVSSEVTYSSADEGKAVIESIKLCDDTSGKLYYWNPFEKRRVYAGEIILSGTCSKSIEIENPYKCQVEGRVLYRDNGDPAENMVVGVNSLEQGGTVYGTTDSQGRYSINVPCGEKLELFVSNSGWIQYRFSVNNTVESTELQDDGKQSTLRDILIADFPPEGSAWIMTRYVKKGNDAVAQLMAWDIEGNLPVRYKMSIYDSNNNEVDSTTGTVNENYDVVTENIGTTSLSPGTYQVIFKLVDSRYTGDITQLSQEVTTVNAGYFTVYEGNPAPVITLFRINPSRVSSAGQQVDVYGTAYDIEGEDITGSSIEYSCYDNAGSQIESGSIDATALIQQGEMEFTIPDNQDIKECNLTWVVTDSSGQTSTSSRTVYVENLPPYVNLFTENGIVPAGTPSVTVESYIWDPEGDPYTCKWYINGAETQHTDCQQIEVDLTGYQDGALITVELEVTDSKGNVSRKDVKIYYGGKADVDITIQ